MDVQFPYINAFCDRLLNGTFQGEVEGVGEPLEQAYARVDPRAASGRAGFAGLRCTGLIRGGLPFTPASSKLAPTGLTLGAPGLTLGGEPCKGTGEVALTCCGNNGRGGGAGHGFDTVDAGAATDCCNCAHNTQDTSWCF